jgi:PAS domain S-box-containing protein
MLEDMLATPPDPIRVLHLEDNPRDADLIGHKLRSHGVPCEIELTNSEAGFDTALAGRPFDMILCDYNVPGYDGISALKRAKQLCPEAPVIIISGTVGEEEAVRCLQAGATDYLLKERLERLGPAVLRAIQEAENRRSRSRAEDALQQRERRLSSIYDAAADGLFFVDVERDGGYRMVSVNPAFVAMTGLEHDEIAGKRLEEVIPDDSLDIMLERFHQAIEGRTTIRWEQTSDYPKGRRIGEISVAPVVDASGTCTNLVGSVHDLTAHRLLEAQLRQAQKMECVGQLAGGIAHDFNTLLTVINGMAELVLDQLKSGDEQTQDDVREIRNAGERAAGLTRQLLAFSRKQILQPEIVDLNAVTAEMGSMLRRLLGEDVELVITPSAGPATVKADRGQIEQVLANLAVNARDAMPAGGRLTIEASHVDIGGDHATSKGYEVADGPYVVLAVRDNGTGMDPATRAQIFEPFFTTKGPGKGTGLGLSTVLGIVEQSGGWLDVESAVGAGTCFTIYLPYVPDAANPRRLSTQPDSARGTETVLIVEDVVGLRRLITRTLESAGYTVLAAASGEQALELLEQYEERVHVLVTDIVMPGMNGRILSERVCADRPEIKVLYMSGYTDDVTLRSGIVTADTPFISKPFGMADLIRKLREVSAGVPRSPALGPGE